MSLFRALLLALAAALPRCAIAGSFDTYQLIMWQDHTPAEVEGLKRLGFTAVRMSAGGDPAAAQRVGLPWYVENIATDFYAAYHRYTPGKLVNWRFTELQARHRADPSDASVFLREPSLSDPVWRDRIAARLKAMVTAQRQYGPLFYNLGDESGIADLAAAWDFDLGAESLAGMRAWLRTQYPSLAALNQEWGTRFDDWDAVTPELTDATLARADGNHAAWADFKAWMDVAFAGAVQAGTRAVHDADPAALAALEGGQVPGWGGYDYFRLAPSVDLMEIYDAGDAVAVARAANPDLIVLRTSFAAGDGGETWRNLLQGGRGTIVWDEGAIVAPDGAPMPRGEELARVAADVRRVAPAIMASRPARDAVAVLVSQASFRTAWLLDRRPGGPLWSSRDAARENEDNVWRASRRETLQRLFGLGIQPLLVSPEMVAAGLLGVRVLILPHAIALSDAEVAAIRRFAAAGGTVLADTEPGLFDGHSRRRDAPPLAGIAQIPEAMLRAGAMPSSDTLEAEAALLGQSGIVPRAVFRTPDGRRATGLEARWFDAPDGATILSLQAIVANSAPPEIEIALPAPRTAVDLRRPGAPMTAARLRIRLDRAEPTILSLRP